MQSIQIGNSNKLHELFTIFMSTVVSDQRKCQAKLVAYERWSLTTAYTKMGQI